MKRFPLRPRAIHVMLLLALARGLSSGQEVNEKAGRYYDSLLKRPAPGAVFDRFYSAWLDTKTVDELEGFLKSRAESGPPAARLLLAFFYARQNDNVKAIAQFRLAVGKDGANADAWYQKALAEARTLDFDSALASLNKAAEARPPAAMLNQIRQMQGRWLARNGKTEDAVKVWQALIAANPEDEELREDLIELQITEGLNDQALATAQELLEKTKDPYRKVQRRMRLGDIHQRAGRRDKAIETYLQCLDETGSDSWLEKEILSQVEQTFRKDDALEGLKQEFQKLTAKYPQRVSLRRQYAKLLAETRETDAAVKEFTKILELTPGNRELREAFVDLLVQAKMPREAATQMQELVRLNPADIELLVKLADLYFEMQQPDDCRRTVDTFLAKSDQSEASWLRAAGMLDRYKLTDDALALFRKTAEKFAGSETAQDALAVALHKSGKKDEAVAVWKKLAEGGNRTRLMNVARSASTREEHKLAYELLTARLAEFGKDALYLTQLCDIAQRLEKHTEAVPWARTLVGLSQDAVELEGNLTLLMRVAGKADALPQLLTELKSSAQTPQEKCLLAELLDNGGDPKGAESVLREVEKAQPELAAAVLVRLQIQRGDSSGAADTLKRLVESPNGRKGVHVQRLVDLYERAGRVKDALAWIPEWKKLSPGSNMPWQKEAALHFQAGDSKEALRSLRQASQEFEDNVEIKAMLADAFRQEGKLADAERLYTVLYEDAKEMSDKIRWAGELADVAQASGKLAELIETFEERRKANRSSLQPLLALAEIYRVSENYEGRRRTLLEAARLKENDLDLLLEIARIEEVEEDYPHALETLKKAEALDKTGKVKQRTARLYFKSGDAQKGMAALRQLADGKFDPRLAEALAESLCDQEMWKEAGEFLEPLLKKHPDDYRLFYLDALAAEEGGRTEEAARRYQHLLTMRKELPAPPGASGLAGLLQSHDDTEEMRRFAPQEVLDILRVRNLAWQAYSHRQNGRYGGGYGGQSIHLPSSVEDSQGMSMVHLAFLARELPEEQRAGLITDIRAQGIRAAELLMEMVQGDRMDQAPDFEAMLEKSPDDDVILSLAAILGGQRGDGETDSTVNLRVYEALKTKRPELAWLAGLRLGAAEEPGAAAAYTQTVAAIEKLESPPAMVLSAAIESLNNSENGESDTLPEENRRAANRLLARLPGWYRRADPKSGQGEYAFLSIAAQLSREDDLTPFLRLFEEEIAAAAADPAKTTSTVYGGNPFSGRRGNSLLEPLAFPPRRLQDYSASVLSLLTNDGDNYYGRSLELDPEKLKPALAGIKDPVLRLLLTARTGDEEEVTKLAAAMTASAEPSLNAFLLHAAWLAGLEKYDEACALLRRAQYLPMTKEFRRMVDSSQILWALTAQEAGELKPEDPLLTGAREAVLRMRREALTPANRGELAGCMEQLGLKKEAERLAGDVPVTAPTRVSRRVVSSYSPRGQIFGGSGGGRIEQFIQKGKREEALKELTKQLKSFTKTWVTSTDLRYQAREWTETVSRHGFNKQLLEAFTPPADANADTLAQWAAAQEILGENRKALDTYRKAVAMKPQDAALRQTFLNALIMDNPAKALEELQSYDPPLLLSVTGAVTTLVSQASSNATRITLLETLLGALEKLPQEERDKANPAAVLQAAEYGFQTANFGAEGELGSLYHVVKSPVAEEEPDAATVDLRKRRLEAHQRLTGLLMRSPATARRSFELHAGVALSVDPAAAKKDLDRLALEVLETEAKLKSKNAAVYSQPASMGMRNGIVLMPIRMPDPETYLLERAWENKNPASVTNELLPRLKGTGRAAQAKKIEDAMPLYFCTEQEFAGVVPAYVKKQSRALQQGGLSWPWLTVLRVMDLRSLKSDLTDTILESLKAAGSGYFNGNEFTPLYTYAARLRKEGDVEGLRRLFSRMAEQALGPKEKRAEMIAKNYNPSSYSANTPNGMIMVWLQFLRTTWQSGDLVLFAAESYTLEFLAYSADNSSAQQDQLFQYGHQLTDSSFYHREPKEVVEMFRGTRITAALPDFLSFSSLPSQRSLLMDIALNIAGPEKKKLREAFAKEPATFGTELLLKAMDTQSFTEAALTVTGAHLEEIRKLNPFRQQDLASMLQVAERRESMEGRKLTPAQQAALQWSVEVTTGGTGDRVAKIMALKSFKGARVGGDYEFSQTLTPLLYSLVKTRPDEAVQLFLKVRGLYADARKAGMGSNVEFGDNSSVLGSVLTTFASNDSTSSTDNPETAAASLGFLLRAASPVEGFAVEWKPDLFPSMTQMLLRIGSTPGENRANAKFSIRLLLPALAGVRGMNPVAMLPAARGLFNDRTLMNEVDVKWLEEQATSGTAKDLAGVLLRGYHLSAKDGKHKAGETVPPVPEDRLLLAFLGDASISPSLRASVAGELLGSSASRFAEPVRLAAATLAAECWKLSLPLTEMHGNSIASSLSQLHTDVSAPPPENFRAAALDLLKAWQRLSGSRQQGNFGYQTSGSDALESSTAFALAMDTDDDTVIRQMLASLPGNATRDWLVKLIGAKRFETARLMLRSGGEAVFGDPSEESSLTWTQELADRGREFVATLNSDEERFLGELLIASLPDDEEADEGDAKGKEPPLVTRMKDFASRLPAKFTNPLVQERVLDLFFTQSPVPAGLGDSLTAWAANQTFGTIATADDVTVRQRRSRLFTEYLRGLITKGDLVPVKEAMFQLVAAVSGQRSYYAGDAARPVLALWIKQSGMLMASPDPAVRKIVREVWRELAFSPDQRNVLEGQCRDRVARALLYDAMDDKVAEFSEAAAGLPEQVRRRAAGSLAGTGVASLGRIEAKWPSDAAEALKAKSQVTVRLLQNTLTWPMEAAGHLRTLASLIDQGWLTTGDALAAAPVLVERHPREGRTEQELALLFADAGKGTEALVLLDKAATRLDEEDRAGRVWLTLTRATVLEKSAREEEALALLGSLKPEDLAIKPKGQQETMEPLVRAATSRIELGAAWRKGGAPAVIDTALKHMGDDPASKQARLAVSAAFTLLASKHEAAGDKAAALPFRSAAFLVLGGDVPASFTEYFEATKALKDARKAAGDPLAPYEAVGRNGVWRYTESAEDFDAWMQPDYDDSGWKSGEGPIGTGIPAGPIRTETSSIPEVMAFRTKFTLPDPDKVKSLSLELMRGDGAAIYLNGKELARNNLHSEGELTEEDHAENMVTDTEALQWRPFRFSREVLGTLGKENVLSVILYQYNSQSTGLAFGLSARINDLEPAELAKSIDRPTMEKALGDLWTRLPEKFREAVWK